MASKGQICAQTVQPVQRVWSMQALPFSMEMAGHPAEMHIFPKGGHGFWMRDRYKYKAETYPMVMRWIEQFKTKKK